MDDELFEELMAPHYAAQAAEAAARAAEWERVNTQGLSDEALAWYYNTTPAPSRDGCMVLLFGLSLVAFEGLVRWLA